MLSGNSSRDCYGFVSDLSQLIPKRALARADAAARLPTLRVEAGTSAVRIRKRRRARSRRLLVQRLLALTGVVVATGVGIGLAYAGSPGRIADGVTVAGVDVGGLTAAQATAKLEARARAVANVPVTFTAGARSLRLRPGNLGVEADWGAAVKLAERRGDGFGPVRGFRRLGVRVFGADVSPPTRVWAKALDYELTKMSRAVGAPHRDAAIALRGLRPSIVPGRTGRGLDRKAAASAIVQALVSLDRSNPVALPVQLDSPTVSATDLASALAQTRTALSGRIRMSLGASSWWLWPGQIATLLSLPHAGTQTLSIGGAASDRYFQRLGRGIGRPPRDASFRVLDSGRVFVVPSRPGRVIDVVATRRNMLAAALSPTDRSARVVVNTQDAKRTTAQARAMGITTRISRYETIYGGDPNRIHNVQLVARLIDGKLIAPGATFSFNHATGARTASKGFLEAPVIINGEVTTGLGGGVCQVSTTVFNAAYEAGLKITQRTNHALYISHYPQGRDATVDYPDVDLKFVNDTAHWLLLRTFVGSYSLVVDLYGAPIHRRVVSESRPLVEAGAPPIKRVPDPALLKGVTELEDSGEPSRSTSVRRLVYLPSGKLLYDNTWYSSYRAEPRIVLVGTKQRPKGKHKGPSGPSGPSGPTGPTGARQ
jgi:vancomycin resistance protein YoaR